MQVTVSREGLSEVGQPAVSLEPGSGRFCLHAGLCMNHSSLCSALPAKTCLSEPGPVPLAVIGTSFFSFFKIKGRGNHLACSHNPS